MSSTPGSPPPRHEVEYTPTPREDEPTGLVMDGVWFASEQVVHMTEHLALFNATGDSAHINNLAALCSEILGHQPAPPAPVHHQRPDPFVRRKRREIARIFKGRYDTTLEDCYIAVDAFEDLWGSPPVPIKPLALFRLVKHLQIARRRGLRIRSRYHRAFIETICETEANGHFITWDAREHKVMRKLENLYKKAMDRVDSADDE